MSNVAGQAYAFMAMTPIQPGSEAELRAYLEALPRDPSPFARVPRTHFARWVIVPDWFVDEDHEPHADHLDLQYLVFTSNFDAPLDSYLDELCDALAAEAKEIWGRCVGCSPSATSAELKAYLLHNQIDTGFFVAAYPQATVAQVQASLRLRERVVAFALEAQELDPAALRAAFDAELGR